MVWRGNEALQEEETACVKTQINSQRSEEGRREGERGRE